MNLLLLTEEDRVTAATFRIADSRDGRLRHLRDVLHVEPGQTLRAGLLSTAYGTCRVTRVTRHAVDLEAAWRPERPRLPDVDVLLALPRPRLLKRLLPELTALGLRRLVFTETARVEKAYFGATALAPDTYRPFLLEGLAQARLVHPPTVEVDRRFFRFLEERVPAAYADHDRLAAHPECETDLGDLRLSEDRPVLLAVGPEGGFIKREVEALSAAGFHVVFLSRRILRVETACVAFLAQVDLLRRSTTGGAG